MVDTSALLVVIQDEEEADSFIDTLEQNEIFLPATVLVESHILAINRGLSHDLHRFVRTLDASVVPVDTDLSQTAIQAYFRYGKGRHKASLNFGDCFVYATAKTLDLPLLFKGDDFGNTDLKSFAAA